MSPPTPLPPPTQQSLPLSLTPTSPPPNVGILGRQGLAKYAQHSAFQVPLNCQGSTPIRGVTFRSHCGIPRDTRRSNPTRACLRSEGYLDPPVAQTSSRHNPAQKQPLTTPWPCPGITEDDIPKVQKYLQHTGAFGGDLRPVFKLRWKIFRGPSVH
jgi:hypothetical protein